MEANTEGRDSRNFQIREMFGGWEEEGKAPTGAFAADRFLSAKTSVNTQKRPYMNT